MAIDEIIMTILSVLFFAPLACLFIGSLWVMLFFIIRDVWREIKPPKQYRVIEGSYNEVELITEEKEVTELKGKKIDA